MSRFCCATFNRSRAPTRFRYASRAATSVAITCCSSATSAIARRRSDVSSAARSLSIVRSRQIGWLNCTRNMEPRLGLGSAWPPSVSKRCPDHVAWYWPPYQRRLCDTVLLPDQVWLDATDWVPSANDCGGDWRELRDAPKVT